MLCGGVLLFFPLEAIRKGQKLFPFGLALFCATAGRSGQPVPQASDKCGPEPAEGATSTDEVAHRRAGWRRLAAPAAHTRWVFYWPPLPSDSKSRAGGATPCAGRNPSLRSVASALAPQTQATIRKNTCDLRSLGPAAPPSAGSDTRRCSCLHAGRLTQSVGSFVSNLYLIRPRYSLRPVGSRARRRPLAEGCRWALQPISLLGTTSAGVKRWVKTANKRKPFLPARRENPVQKQSMLLNDFPPYPRRAVPLGTRNGQPIPLQAYTSTSLYPQEKTALRPGRPRVPAVGYGQPLPPRQTANQAETQQKKLRPTSSRQTELVKTAEQQPSYNSSNPSGSTALNFRRRTLSTSTISSTAGTIISRPPKSTPNSGFPG